MLILDRRVPSQFIMPVRRNNYVSFALGGVSLQDTSQGLVKYLWRSDYHGGSVVITNGQAIHSVLIKNPLDWVDFDFDFNMNLTLTYTSNGLGYLYWYDPVQNGHVTLQLGMCKTPTVCLTEHTPELSDYADVYLLYIRDGVYYARYLNERYAIEHVISTDYPNTKINTFGVSVNNRLQVRTVFDKGE